MKLLLLLLLFQTPEDIYKAANAAFEAGHWAEAAAGYQKLLETDPANLPSEFGLAMSYSKLGKDDQAVSLYRKILEQDDSVYEVRINLAILLAKDGNTAGADEQFAKASALKPNDPIPVFYRARLLDRRGDIKGAQENYERAIQLSPNDPEIRFVAGLFYFNSKQFDKAYENLTAAEQHGSATPQLFIALSETAHFLKHDDKSREYLEKAVALDPQNKGLQRQLGIAYHDAGQSDKAIELLKPLLPVTRVELASTYFEKKDYENALPLLTQLVAEEPANTDYLYLLGKSQKELKHYPEAVATLLREIRLRPDDADAFNTLGSSYFVLQDWAHAIVAIERFVQLKPKPVAFSYYVLGICYDKLGNSRQALLNYNKFLEIDDGSNDAQTFQARERAKSLGILLKQKGGSSP